MTDLPRLSRWWYAGIALLSVGGYWYATDFLSVAIYAGLFLPALLGWLAYRYSADLSTLWLWVGALTAFGASYNLTDTLSFGLGFDVLFAAIAVAAVYILARPVPIEKLAGLLNHRWRWLRWLIPVALWLSIYVGINLSFDWGDSLTVGFDPGLILLLIIAIGSIDVKTAYGEVRHRLTHPDRPWRSRFKLAIATALVLATVINLQFDVGYAFSLGFGLYGRTDLLLVFVIVIAALGLVDWRIMVGGLLVFFALEWPIFWLVDAVDAALESLMDAGQADASRSDSAPGTLAEIKVTGSRLMRPFWRESGLILGLSSLLMATAFTPFVHSRSIGDLYTRRAAGFIAAAFLVIFAGMISLSYGVDMTGYFFAGIVAYLCGLRWQVRGMLLSPLIIQFVYLFFVQMIPDPYEVMYSALNVINMALYIFAFAYFGFLSNRLLDEGHFGTSLANDRAEAS